MVKFSEGMKKTVCVLYKVGLISLNTNENKYIKRGVQMKNYIQDWVNNGCEKDNTTVQVSARVSSRIGDNIEELCAEFGIKRSAVIEAALDYGTQDLLEEVRKMNESNVKMVGRLAKEQGKEEEFKKMVKGAKNA
jgi:hypothetical protein